MIGILSPLLRNKIYYLYVRVSTCKQVLFDSQVERPMTEVQSLLELNF